MTQTSDLVQVLAAARITAETSPAAIIILTRPLGITHDDIAAAWDADLLTAYQADRLHAWVERGAS